MRGRQLPTALANFDNCGLEGRKVTLHSSMNDRGDDAVVLVPNHIPHRCYLRPRNSRILINDLTWQGLDGFPNHKEVVKNGIKRDLYSNVISTGLSPAHTAICHTRCTNGVQDVA